MYFCCIRGEEGDLRVLLFRHLPTKPRRNFKEPEIYLEQSVGGTATRTLLRCRVRCRRQALCPLKCPGPLEWQRSSVGNLFLVLGDSAFGLCEVLGSVTVAAEKCQDPWSRVSVIKAGMLQSLTPGVQCPPFCTVSVASNRVELPRGQEEATEDGAGQDLCVSSGFRAANPAGWVLTKHGRDGSLVSAVGSEQELWLLKPTNSCGGHSYGSTESDLA